MHRGRPDTEHLVDAYKNYSLNPASYYCFNGTCNNLQHKQWGAVVTCYKRMLRAYYEDKRSEPKLPECKMTTDVSNDPVLLERNATCINYVRLAVCPCESDGPRRHMNSLTAYLDLSLPYGSAKKELDRLRD
ncbi:uncharacterized protein LOC111245935 [Varroa destructor]|uniref:Uncharacterized protein n=1 Tax=Varroa destructor TaxID=109461 RepID=A0A7M7JE01_VARDE|nr:uncharacterized protein LOC111245935 [Varroa destructor]